MSRKNTPIGTYLEGVMPFENRTNISKEIGLRLKKLREKKFGNSHGSQKECALRLNITPGYWGSIEHGRKLLGLDKIYELADFFECDPEWLAFGIERKNWSHDKLTAEQMRVLKYLYGLIDEALDMIRVGNDGIQKILENPAFAEEAIDLGLEDHCLEIFQNLQGKKKIT